ASSSTNSSVMWTGPGSFTSAAFTFTTGTGGTYTVTVTDITSNCPASTIIIVTTNTSVPITATIIPATCSGTMANNDGSIFASGYGAGDKYDIVSGLTYTGSATYATAIVIPGSGMLINTLNNPPLITPYTVRFFAANGCTKDTTLFLIPTSCITNTIFGVAKAVSTPTVKPDGTYDVNYFVVIKNTGAQQLNNIALTENLAATFPLPTTYSIVTAPVVTSMNSSISINASFDGSVQTVMTNTTLSAIAPGKTDTIMFTVNLAHHGNFGPFNNTVLGFASPTIGVVFGDSSNTAYDTDPDLDGDPTNNNIPTILNLPPKLFFGLTKAGTLSDKLDDNTWDITYTVTVHNLGNDTLKNVVVKDSLFNNTIRLPATYSIKSGPTATGSLVANTSFNGNSDINLLNASQSVLPPGSVNSIVFTINVNPDTITIVKNSAYGTAINTTSITVSDTSNAGTNPDVNGNGVWNEPSDNIPTVLSIPNSSLFIPGGFSPDGDGKNDFFVIKGLSSGIDNTFTVYNRWGNKVYSKNNYDNTWNGYPNVSGTLGNQKLPQGTYYYTLDFKTGDNKTMYGFIVIQY
ncbi:MAG: gliding motility-associated C-terminal domain-containing protein, partial [Bacteroidia bacterium]